MSEDISQKETRPGGRGGWRPRTDRSDRSICLGHGLQLQGSQRTPMYLGVRAPVEQEEEKRNKSPT